MTAAQHLEDATSDLETALSILHRLLPPVSTIQRLQPSGDPGCASCRRVKTSRGLPYFSDTEERVSGNHRPLCIWCRRWSDAYRDEWVAEHPNQPVPTDPRRFYPPIVAVEWRRDNEGKNATPRLWIEWRAAKRAEKKGRKKAS